MSLWLIIIILAYFLFALVSLADKYILIGPPQAKTYAFYVGILGALVLLLIPFVGFSVPGLLEILFCLLAGALFIFSLLGLYQGLEHFEASRVIPAIGGFLPVFTLILTYFFSGELGKISAFIPLVLGSVLISIEPGQKVSFGSLKISVITAFLFSLTFVLSKYVYTMQPFWNGFIWIRIGAFVTALFFIFTKEIRKEILKKQFLFDKKTRTIFLTNQAVGGGAFVLQNWAISLAPLVYLSVINALQGIQYVFLFLLALLFLKEGLSKKIIAQKFFAILLIGIGLVILTL